jgi:hypothetical protein
VPSTPLRELEAPTGSSSGLVGEQVSEQPSELIGCLF